MQKVNINVAAMRRNEPGVRVTSPDGVKRLFNEVDILDKDGNSVARIVTKGGSSWIEVDGVLRGVRIEDPTKSTNKTPFEEIDWSKEGLEQDHQVNVRVTPAKVFVNDDENEVICEIKDPKRYAFFWGHHHLHIERIVPEGTQPRIITDFLRGDE